ncbi:hypothetical protein CBM2637_P360007 [Cupriavidus taiwanensis]|nr:hypothetical protein CBM2622_P350006 [Cupriavidus taiwanensis]SPA35454.1 hypothetical protein CBM2637_P360007 [Cupriavidus taiwanensis]
MVSWDTWRSRWSGKARLRVAGFPGVTTFGQGSGAPRATAHCRQRVCGRDGWPGGVARGGLTLSLPHSHRLLSRCGEARASALKAHAPACAHLALTDFLRLPNLDAHALFGLQLRYFVFVIHHTLPDGKVLHFRF